MNLRALFVWLLTLVPAFADRPAWNPEKTWVFAVGILRFEGAALHGWPEEGRVDAVMLDALRKRGVPSDHILFLKNEQATAAQIRKRFSEFLRQPGPDDTLIFYYAGHGGRDYSDPARPVHFVPYDSKNSWATAAVLDAIDKEFKGSQVLLTADCCHSGGLAEEAARRKRRISFGTLTSARASATSTGNWTFTQCLADLYSGKPGLDLDRDGAITFAEAAQYSDLTMAFSENQRSTSEATGSFPHELIFAQPTGPAPARVAVRCEGRDSGKWYKAEILSARDGKYFVTWPGWDRTNDSWLTPENLRPAERKILADGTTVEIEWGKTWYPGKVVRSELGLLLVHYDGYTAADNEWVPIERVRVPK
jgi:Caspase domain/RNA binding activity-knot of a chromodomain